MPNNPSNEGSWRNLTLERIRTAVEGIILGINLAGKWQRQFIHLSNKSWARQTVQAPETWQCAGNHNYNRSRGSHMSSSNWRKTHQTHWTTCGINQCRGALSGTMEEELRRRRGIAEGPGAGAAPSGGFFVRAGGGGLWGRRTGSDGQQGQL